MTFLQLNDWPIPCERIEQTDSSRDSSAVSVNGYFWSERIFNTRSWQVTTTLISLDDAEALFGLLTGRGHHWSFNSDLYSDKGLTDNGAGSWALVGSGAKFGSDCVEIDAGVTIALPSTYENQWTIGLWTDLGAGTWQHRLQTSDGDQWQDGVKGTFAGWDYAPTASSFTIPVGVYDDLVILPYAASTDMGNNWPLTSPFGDIPYMRLEGDFSVVRPLAGASYTTVACEGSPSVSHVQVGASTRATYKAQVSFNLREEQP